MKNKFEKLLTSPIRQDRKPLQELLPLEQPLRIFIDPCDICNFRCSFCFQSHKDFRGSIMSENIFNTVIQQLKEFKGPINVIHLYGHGEPMLNGNLPEFVKRLKENGVAKEVVVTSNGSRLSEEYSQRLVEAGLDRLSISLNGLSTGQFKKIVGVEADFERIYSSILYFYSIRKNCHLHIKINGECFSEEEQQRFICLFQDCCDTFNIDHVVNIWPGMEMTREREHTIYDFDEDDAKKIRGGVLCPQMFYELMVHSDGSVSPCCADCNYQNENLGNVALSTLKEIWNSEKLLQIRLEALKGKEISYGICQACDYPVCASSVNISQYREELLSKYDKGEDRKSVV